MCHNLYHIHSKYLAQWAIVSWYSSIAHLKIWWWWDDSRLWWCEWVCTVRGHMEELLMRERGTLLAAVCSHCTTLDQLKHLCWSSKNHIKITVSLQWPKTTQWYLNNCMCYNKIVCTVLFSSRWQVYCYELFSVLSTLQKWQNFDKMPSQGVFIDLDKFLTIWDIDTILMCSWFWVRIWINFVVSCLVAELFKLAKMQSLNSTIFRYQNSLVLWCSEHFASGWKKCWNTPNSNCA